MAPYCRDGKRQYRSALKELVASQPAPTHEPLPLTHVTDSIRLPGILVEGQLTPRSCPVFGDLRLYAFYARPAYRGSKKGPLHNLNFAPVCFIIDSSVTRECCPVEVIPFDTGALRKGVLAGHVHGDLSPFDFALKREVASAQRLARLFFGDERAYYSGMYRPMSMPEPKPTHAEIVAYASLIRSGSNKDRDERGTSIEFQFKDPLPLKGKILAIILPHDFLDVPEIRKAIRTNKIAPLP